MSAPRVLVSGVVLAQPMGGVRRHNAELLPRLARLLDARGGALAVLAGRAGVPFELPPPIATIASRVPWQPPLARAVLEGRALRRVLAERAFDLVHTGHLPLPRGLDLPVTLTLHDLRNLARGAGSGRMVLRSAARRAGAVFTPSASMRAAITAELGVPAERVHVVPNGADHLAVLARAPSSDAKLLCVGHLEPRKNLELVLRALAIDRELPGVVLAGAAKGDHARRLCALARELGVEERVELLGPFDEARLPELYATCAAVVVPSRVEGFGIAAVEAQRARAPLAIARIAPLVEVAGEAPSFAPDDPEECAHAIRAALTRSPESIERDAMRAARFTWDASAAAWCDALCALDAAGG